jgi:hypothetical protein
MPVPSLAAVKGNNRHKLQGLKSLYFVLLSQPDVQLLHAMDRGDDTLVVAVENSSSSGGSLSGAEESITVQHQVSRR